MSINVKQEGSRKLGVYNNGSYKRSISPSNDVIDFDFDDYFCAVLIKDKVELYDINSGSYKRSISCKGASKVKLSGGSVFITEGSKTKEYDCNSGSYKRSI